jgi:hypothetical protein
LDSTEEALDGDPVGLARQVLEPVEPTADAAGAGEAEQISGSSTRTAVSSGSSCSL